MEKRITVDEFLKTYNKFSSDTAKQTYLKTIIKHNQYVGYATKIVMANMILEKSCFNKDTGEVCFDSCKKYLMYVWAVLHMYTLIDMNVEHIMDDYDKLESNNWICLLMSMIPERELKQFDTVLKMRQDDLIANHCGLEHYLDRKMNKGSNEWAKVIQPALTTLTQVLENIDEDKMVKLLGNFIA